MRKLIWVVVVGLSLALSVEAFSVDITVRGQPVTTFEDGRPQGASFFRYVWLQGPTADSLRPVGETPTAEFWRLSQSDTVHCFSYMVIHVDRNEPPSTARRLLGQGDAGPTTCMDFTSGNDPQPPLTLDPATPGAPVVERRTSL